MDTKYDGEYLSTFTVSQFKAFRKAVNILIRAGFTREVAVATLLEAHRNKLHNRYAA